MKPADQYAQVLAPLRRLDRAELLRQLAMLGMPVSKQTLSRWLTDNVKTRVQPSFGAGLILLQAAALAERETHKRESILAITGDAVLTNKLTQNPPPSGKGRVGKITHIQS